MDDNQTAQLIETVLTGQSQTSQDGGFDVLILFRVMYYLVIMFLVALYINQNQQILTTRGRIKRKYLHSFQQMVKFFKEDDIKAMEIIVENTLRNTQIQVNPKLIKKRNNYKKVNFKIACNDYYDPLNQPQMEDDELQTDCLIPQVNKRTDQNIEEAEKQLNSLLYPLIEKDQELKHLVQLKDQGGKQGKDQIELAHQHHEDHNQLNDHTVHAQT